MIITKIITVGVDLQNPINVYSDINANMLNILNNRYKESCYAGCYILEVTKIIEMSDCYINQDGAPTFGTVNVRFAVRAISLLPGEVINGCKVCNKDERSIVCSTPYASIIMSANPSLESITAGQIISVMVGSTKYNIGAKKITVNAIPFMPNKVITIYKCVATAEPMGPYFEWLMELIDEEEKRSAAVREANKRGWEFFSGLLYAYEKKPPTPAGAVELNVKDLVGGTPRDVRYVVRDPRTNPAEPIVYGYSDPSKLEPGTKVKVANSMKDVLTPLLAEYYNGLRTVREMTEIYNTAELIESHKNLWRIYKKAKIGAISS